MIANNQPSINELRIGANGMSATLGEVLNGDIAEIIVYNKSLTNIETYQVNAYLANKYCLNNSVPPPIASNQNSCGSSSFSLTASGGKHYRWYNGNSSSIILDTNDIFVTPVLPTTDTFYVANYNDTLESVRTMVIATVLPRPSAPTGTVSQTFCNTATVVDLIATGSGLQWYASATGGSPLTGTIALTNSTSYFASQTVSSCERATRFEVAVTINYSSTGTDVQTAFNSYLWIDGNTYTANNNIATHTLTNAIGCDSVVILNLTINTLDLSTSVNNNTITANATGATYQWIDCDNDNLAITDATNQSYTAITNGNYAVVVTKNDCSDTSACITINTTGINTLTTNPLNVRIFPNPIIDVITIQVPVGLDNVLVDVYDITGKKSYPKKYITTYSN